MLSNLARSLLLELQMSPAWAEVLDSLRQSRGLCWRDDGADEAQKIAKWHFASGQQAENDRILAILQLKE